MKKKCWYDSIVISDHAAISLNMHIEKFVYNPPSWRLQVRWLQDPEVVKYVGTKIDSYFELNTFQTSASTRWEAFKAYIRGEIISYTSSKVKQQRATMETLKKRIKSLQISLNVRDDPRKHKDLLLLRAEYNKLSVEKV